MSENHLVAEGYSISPLLRNYCFKLLLLSFGAGSRLRFFCLYLLRVHIVVDFERGGGEDFKEGLTVVGDVDDIGGAGEEGVLCIVDLKV